MKKTKLEFITDGNFEDTSLESLLSQIDSDCFEKGNFDYQIQALMTTDDEGNEIILSEEVIRRAQDQLDCLLRESELSWKRDLFDPWDEYGLIKSNYY